MALSMSNAVAVIEGYLRIKSSFVRTPKFNVAQKDEFTGNKNFEFIITLKTDSILAVSNLQKVKGETIQFKSKPAYWYLVTGTKKGFTYNQFNLMIKLSKETYFTAYSEIYGTDKVDERICESISLLDKIEFLQ